jgi:hypothetical protein
MTIKDFVDMPSVRPFPCTMSSEQVIDDPVMLFGQALPKVRFP